jgi:hypothetical protein
VSISPKHQASANSNTVSISVDPGDCVFVACSGQSVNPPGQVTDNGGNSYVLFNSNTLCGFCALYVCISAAFSATSVTFPTQSAPVILVATYSSTTSIFVGSTGVNLGSSGGGGSTIGSALTTAIPNSRVVSLFVFWNSGNAITLSATSGVLELQKASIVSGVIVGMGVVDQLSTTPGAYTNAVVASGGNAQYQSYWNIEIGFLSPTVGKETIGPQAASVPTPSKRTSPTTSGASLVFQPVPVAAVLNGGTTGVAYSETISAQGGTAAYTYSVLSGSLPPGLTLNPSTGVISGTPTTVGTYPFYIKVVDISLFVGVQNFSITVAAPTTGGGGGGGGINWGWIG